MASVINQIKFNDIEYAIAASAYAECSTAAGTAAKTATICTDGDTTNTGFALVKGVSVKVKFAATNTASNPTLNINGTGAKAIRYQDSSIATDYLVENKVYEFVYTIIDGTGYWELVGDIPTISGIAAYSLGGISKGTQYTNKSIVELLNDLLFPYITPSLTNLSLYKNANDTSAISEAEYGETITIKAISPTFSGSDPIISIKIGKSQDDTSYYNGTSATSGSKITLTNSWAPSKTSSDTIYCTISDGKNISRKTKTFNRVYYNYSTVSSSATAPTSGLTKQTATGGEALYPYSAGNYVWLYDRSNNKKIQQQDAGEWFDVAMAGPTQVTITLSSGASATYYAYRTSKMASSGSATYRLA